MGAGSWGARIALIYLALGSTWVMVSDWLLARVWTPPGAVGQTAKGLVFVALSALLIHVLLQRALLEQRKSADERAGLERRLAAAARFEAIGQLAGGIAHDFNNLLTAIAGNLESYVRRRPSGEPPEELVDAMRSAERAAELTRQLLAFGRRQAMSLERVDINTVVQEMTGLLDQLMGRGVRIRAELDSSPHHVQVDRGQLEQVVMNLAINARDAMPAGGEIRLATANTRIDADAARHFPFPVAPGRYVRFDVIDSGAGMTPDVQAHIFEPFFTTKPKGTGTGLGLATVYGIVTQSGGYVHVETAPGQGSTFSVLLPESDNGDASVPAPAKPDPGPDPTGSETILVVDDEPAVRSLIVRILDRAGFAVLEAPDGPEGLAILRECQGSIDLLITDAAMSAMTGSELAAAARTLDPALAVLLISGYQAEEFDGSLPYLGKPFTHAQLTRRVRELLDG